MRAKISVLLVLVMMSALLLTGCGSGSDEVAPVVEIEGVKITIGTSTPQVLITAGFERNLGFGFDDTTLEPNTIASQGCYYSKEAVDINITPMNSGTETLPVDDCIIQQVMFTTFLNGKEYPDVLVNGTNFKGYDATKLKEHFLGMEITQDTPELIEFSSGTYIYRFPLADDGTVANGMISKKVTVDYDY